LTAVSREARRGRSLHWVGHRDFSLDALAAAYAALQRAAFGPARLDARAA